MSKNKLIRVVLLNLALLAVGVVVLELIFGNWLHPDRIGRLNLVRARTIHYDASALYPPPNAVTYTRDAYGFRGRYHSPGDIDILTVGGSTTDQRFITDGRTWQDVLVREFAAAGKHVSIVNAGIDGQSTYGHIKDFEWWFPHVPGLAPRYILFYVGINDVYKDAGSDYDDLLRYKRMTWKGEIRESSAIYRVVSTLWNYYQARHVRDLVEHHEDMSVWKWTTEPLVHDHATLAAARLHAYRLRLEVLARSTREMGAVPIFVTQGFCVYRVRPDGTVEGRVRSEPYDDARINGVDLYYIMKLFNRTALDVCGEVGGICIDAANEVPWQAGDFYDPVHNTPRGAERLGEYLYGKLRDIPLTDRRREAKAGVRGGPTN
jgi:lysophospholipase L1-like esterase